MEDLGFKQTKEEIQIAGFPDAVKVVQITGEKAKRLADLTLHARCHHSGLGFDLDGFTLPDDEVAHLEVEGFFSPGVHCGSNYR